MEHKKRERKSSPRRAIAVTACMCFLVVAVCFAFWAGLGARSVQRESESFDSLGRWKAQPASQPTRAPRDLLKDPLAIAGVSKLDGDPGRIAPPPQARRVHGIRKRLGSHVEEFARYRWKGTQEAAASHYIKLLTEEKYRLLGKQGQADREETALLFVRQGRRVTVLMKNADDQTVIIRVMLTAADDVVRDRLQSSNDSSDKE